MNFWVPPRTYMVWATQLCTDFWNWIPFVKIQVIFYSVSYKTENCYLKSTKIFNVLVKSSVLNKADQKHFLPVQTSAIDTIGMNVKDIFINLWLKGKYISECYQNKIWSSPKDETHDWNWNRRVLTSTIDKK